MKTEDTVESKMRDILGMNLGGTSVFRIKLWRNDHQDTWWAGAELRGTNGEGYYATNENVLEALNELERILHSQTCSECGRYKGTRNFNSYVSPDGD